MGINQQLRSTYENPYQDSSKVRLSGSESDNFDMTPHHHDNQDLPLDPHLPPSDHSTGGAASNSYIQTSKSKQ